MPVPSPARRLRDAFDRFLREAQQIMQEIESLNEYAPSASSEVDEIKKLVANYYHVSLSGIDARIRTQDYVRARHVAMYICAERTTLNWAQIAKAFHRNNHATVIHACQSVKGEIETSAKFKRQIEDILTTCPTFK